MPTRLEQRRARGRLRTKPPHHQHRRGCAEAPSTGESSRRSRSTRRAPGTLDRVGFREEREVEEKQIDADRNGERRAARRLVPTAAAEAAGAGRGRAVNAGGD